jgi:hypothetical protein
MQVEFFQRISESLSVERLSSYGRLDAATPETILARYLWNLAICESLYSPVQLCEVSLRNQIFHHERVIHWKDLKAKHTLMLEVIRWSSNELHELAYNLDRFTEIHSAGIEPWKDQIQHH